MLQMNRKSRVSAAAAGLPLVEPVRTRLTHVVDGSSATPLAANHKDMPGQDTAGTKDQVEILTDFPGVPPEGPDTSISDKPPSLMCRKSDATDERSKNWRHATRCGGSVRRNVPTEFAPKAGTLKTGRKGFVTRPIVRPADAAGIPSNIDITGA